MRKLFTVSAAAAMLLGSAAFQQLGHASAQTGWCFDDPTIHINGQTVHVTVAVPMSSKKSVQDVRLVVVLPENVDVKLDGPAGRPNGPLNTITTIVRSGSYDGTGAVPMTAYAVVEAPTSTLARLIAQENGFAPVESDGNAGQALAVSLGVE
jgi:hypothetical protein